MKRILVTGGAGYVGSHACKAFAADGWEVTVFDNLSRGWREAVRWGRLIEGDLLDPDALDTALAEARPDIVAHFAALAYVGESVERPDLYYRANSVGTLNLLDAMHKHDVRQLIFSSTCASYGIPRQLPIDEHHPQMPINPYGWSKLFIERMVSDYSHAFGLSAVILRYFNAAGCDPEGELIERHEPETHVIPLAIEAAMTCGTFTINGDDFDTPDGTAVRDFIHVSDLADAHVRAARTCQAGNGVLVLNLGTGVGTSVAAVVQEIERQTGATMRVVNAPRRAGDPAALVADGRKAGTVLGWVPTHSDLATIVATAIAQHRTGADTPVMTNQPLNKRY